MKRYALLKELPGMSLGTIFEDSFTEDYFKGVCGDVTHYFNGSLIRANPSWFHEVKEQLYTEDDMLEAFRAGEMRGDYLAAEEGVRMLGKGGPWKFWIDEFKRDKK